MQLISKIVKAKSYKTKPAVSVTVVVLLILEWDREIMMLFKLPICTIARIATPGRGPVAMFSMCPYTAHNYVTSCTATVDRNAHN